MKLISYILLLAISSIAQDDFWSYCSRSYQSLYGFGQNTVEYFNDNVQLILNREENIKAEAKKDPLEHCVHKDVYGCVYKRKYLTNNFSDTLVIYFQGHWGGYRGVVPLNMRDKSIKHTINYYEIDKTYEKQLDPILISASSDAGFTVDEINAALKAASLPKNANIVLSSHSGGYVGLIKTLKYLDKKPYEFKIKKIIMLDNFYFSSYDSTLIKSFTDKGVECNGFLTEHNLSRYNQRFANQISNQDCLIDVKEDHFSTVNKCLFQYINNDHCDISN